MVQLERGEWKMTRQATTSWEEVKLLPKYYQVKQWILERITLGEWNVGDEIPSEQALSEEYSVSRGTLRRAIDDLVRSGLLTRVQGKSTYVAKPRIPIFSRGFRADIRNTGQSANSVILSYTEVKPSHDVMHNLSLSPGDTVYELRRVILADNDPIILETVFIPILYGQALDHQALLSQSLLDLIPHTSNLILKKAIEWYEPTLLRAEEATLLNARHNDLAILDQAVTYDITDTPIFMSRALLRRDRASILTEVTFHI